MLHQLKEIGPYDFTMFSCYIGEQHWPSVEKSYLTHYVGRSSLPALYEEADRIARECCVYRERRKQLWVRSDFRIAQGPLKGFSISPNASSSLVGLTYRGPLMSLPDAAAEFNERLMRITDRRVLLLVDWGRKRLNNVYKATDKGPRYNRDRMVLSGGMAKSGRWFKQLVDHLQASGRWWFLEAVARGMEISLRFIHRQEKIRTAVPTPHYWHKSVRLDLVQSATTPGHVIPGMTCSLQGLSLDGKPIHLPGWIRGPTVLQRIDHLLEIQIATFHKNRVRQAVTVRHELGWLDVALNTTARRRLQPDKRSNAVTTFQAFMRVLRPNEVPDDDDRTETTAETTTDPAVAGMAGGAAQALEPFCSSGDPGGSPGAE